ncbi:hypothetical protein KHS38_10505 [Mucilaginibacter sp. Bleaf8]|uniref:hypothetical protein n=1 Tax=Mucilaginibacter sp. Bleaf8 TaxID=2834430 RepID=UPI001BCECDC2|nr:hypothetical protein [Mucilaginibacter sp. Bleaf8]MBS7564836.1 hypothetical protein [Mucilaginibacter sp. Bleaf8]
MTLKSQPNACFNRMHIPWALVLSLMVIFTSCGHNTKVNTSFYFWKTKYKPTGTENSYFNKLHCQKLYVRIMDVHQGEHGEPEPVSPINFQSPVADSVELIPVVFIVNSVLSRRTQQQLDDLAGKIVTFVQGKTKQAGKSQFNELQIDCDWTKSTRNNYFYLLQRIRQNAAMHQRALSVTLRLHQLKNQQSSGIPPANRVMLMCYNMGNLRQYGLHNSILEQSELEKYAGSNLGNYALPIDVGLPLFSWAVVFQDKQYKGIAKRVNQEVLKQHQWFNYTGNSCYKAKTDLPNYGIKANDEIRWENIPAAQLQQAAKHLSKHLHSDTINVIYFHLDEPTLKQHTYESLEKTAALFR